MNDTRNRIGIALALLLCCAPPLSAASRYRKQGAKRVRRALQYLEEIMEAPDTAIPTSVFENCRGIIVVRQYKAGFIFGAKGGAGLAMLRDKRTKRWSAPVFIKTGEGSFGLQIGGQSIDTICLIMNKQGVEMLLKSKFKIGVDASAAIGPVGRDAAAKVGPGTALLVYARAKGLYMGAAFEGGLLLLDGRVNRAFYGEGKDVDDILFGRVPMPEEAVPLAKALAKYAGEPPRTPSPDKHDTARKERKEANAHAGPASKAGEPKPAPAVRRGDKSTAPRNPPVADKDKQEKPADGNDRKLLEELSRLKRMREKGLITDQEYRELKRKVLEKYF